MPGGDLFSEDVMARGVDPRAKLEDPFEQFVRVNQLDDLAVSTMRKLDPEEQAFVPRERVDCAHTLRQYSQGTT